MATTLTIGRVTGIYHIDTSVNGDSVTISCAVQESTTALTLNKARQLAELLDNPDWLWHYITWPTNAGNQLDGFYRVENYSIPVDRESLSRYRFDLQLVKLGTLASHAVATQWDNAAIETIGAVWSALVPIKMISLPYLVTNIDWAVADGPVTAGGSNQILHNPTRQTVTYNSSATITNWYAAECKVFDSVVAGDAVEANWIRVFDKHHIFAGDVILENGSIRYKLNSVTGTFFVYDTITNPAGWVNIGDLLTYYLSGAALATVAELSIVRLDADVIEWRERRHYDDDNTQILFKLRRAAQYCRLEVTTTSATIGDAYLRLSKAGQYINLFNATTSGLAGGGALPVDASHCYECGYKTNANVISGFALCDQPSSQPFDPGAAGDYMPIGLAWTTSQTRIFSVIGWSASTSALGNYILNPGFETAGGGGADIWSGWGETAGDGAIADEGTLVHSGSHAAKLTAGPTANTELYETLGIGPPYDVYDLSFWTRGDGTNALRYRVYDYTHATDIIATTSTGVTGATYSRVAASFSRPAGCVSISVIFYCPAANGGIGYVDDVALYSIAGARYSANLIALRSLYDLEQRTIIKPKALVMTS